MEMTLSQTQALECKLCRQLVFEERVADVRVNKLLFGAKGYSVCPCCGQDNLEEMHRKRWQKKVDKYLAK